MIYTELHKQYLSLWIPLILLTVISFFLFIFFPEIAPNSPFSVTIISFALFALVGFIWLAYTKFSIIPVIFSVDEKKLTWTLAKTNVLFPQKEQHKQWQNLTQIARIDDKHHTNYYFSSKDSSNTIMLQQPFVEIEADETWTQLCFWAEKHQIPVKTTFYDNTPPPKNISIFLFSLILSLFFAIGWYTHPHISTSAKISIIIQFLITIYLCIRMWKRKRLL